MQRFSVSLHYYYLLNAKLGTKVLKDARNWVYVTLPLGFRDAVHGSRFFHGLKLLSKNNKVYLLQGRRLLAVFFLPSLERSSNEGIMTMNTSRSTIRPWWRPQGFWATEEKRRKFLAVIIQWREPISAVIAKKCNRVFQKHCAVIQNEIVFLSLGFHKITALVKTKFSWWLQTTLQKTFLYKNRYE